MLEQGSQTTEPRQRHTVPPGTRLCVLGVALELGSLASALEATTFLSEQSWPGQHLPHQSCPEAGVPRASNHHVTQQAGKQQGHAKSTGRRA